ncbi:MAG: PUR family DNA/RNA-binding protein [Flavobacteriales bacterium]|nr:PUR family DNA/RNA-binding protein [Flavobacteriales bacterium]
MDTNNKKDRRDDIFSRNVRAGKRTYFFDVKATRAEDYYLTITESTKRFNDDGSFYYDKHRLFLYKEDFAKYSECLAEVTKYIIDEKGDVPIRGDGGYKGHNGQPHNQNNTETTVSPETSTEETAIGAEKTDEEVGLVEDAHEQAIAQVGQGENEGLDASSSTTNGQTDNGHSEAQENLDPINIGSVAEAKTS